MKSIHVELPLSLSTLLTSSSSSSSYPCYLAFLYLTSAKYWAWENWVRVTRVRQKSERIENTPLLLD